MKPILKQAWTRITKKKGSSNSSSSSVRRTLNCKLCRLDGKDGSYLCRLDPERHTSNFFNYTRKKGMKKLLMLLLLAAPVSATTVIPAVHPGQCNRLPPPRLTLKELSRQKSMVVTIHHGAVQMWLPAQTSLAAVQPFRKYGWDPWSLEITTRDAGIVETIDITETIDSTSTTTSLSIFSQ